MLTKKRLKCHLFHPSAPLLCTSTVVAALGPSRDLAIERLDRQKSQSKGPACLQPRTVSFPSREGTLSACVLPHTHTFALPIRAPFKSIIDGDLVSTDSGFPPHTHTRSTTAARVQIEGICIVMLNDRPRRLFTHNENENEGLAATSFF